jgi:hypothetical protein
MAWNWANTVAGCSIGNWRIVSVAEDQDKGSDYLLVVLKRQQLPKKDAKEPNAPKKAPKQ